MANARQAARGRQSTGNGRANGRSAADNSLQTPPVKYEVTPEAVEQAIQAEAELAAKAAGLRGDAAKLDPKLFLQLLPLVRERIPDGFISEVSAGKGKPYPSKGIRSLQVQIDRMDAVWTPLWWGWRTDWLQPELAEVVVWVGESEEDAFVVRKARGGVNQGSTVGNLYKGTETNAAKMAFARLGVGHEIYLGAADFDPDTDEDAAEQQTSVPVGGQGEALVRIEGERVAQLTDRAQAWVDSVEGEPERKKRRQRVATLLASKGAEGGSITERIAFLTAAQADEVDAQLSAWAEKDGEES